MNHSISALHPCRVELVRLRVTLVSALVLGSAAGRQSYPAHGVKIIGPFAVGQGSNMPARAMSEKLSYNVGVNSNPSS